MLSLPIGEIHLWVAFEEEITDGSLLAQYRSLLSDEEKEQQERFYFSKDQHRYLVTRALVRSALSRYRDIQPQSWRFQTNEYGRPEIEYADNSCAPLWFNISHSKGVIVCAIASTPCLGVDTECVERNRDPLAIADRFFSSKEVQGLRALPAESQEFGFFHYWTLKESYIKARGMGLAIPLNQFSFDLTRPQQIGIEFHAPLDDQPERLEFWLLQPTQTHLLAVCIERPAHTSPTQLRIHECVPLVSERLADYPLLRRSILKI